MTRTGRRSAVGKILCASIFYRAMAAKAALVNTAVWPSSEASGSISRQTLELANLLNMNNVAISVNAGIHVISGPLVATGNGVTLRGETGAQLAFANTNLGGIRFAGGKDCKVENIALVWAGEGKTPRSHYGAGLLFVKCVRPSVSDVAVHRAPGAGIHFDECSSSSVSNSHVVWSGGDGIHFANCNDSIARDCTCEHTGDDCVAVVDYESKPAGVGFLIERCKVQGTRARGIAVVGGADGFINQCEIRTTASNGLHIEQDAHYKTRYPRNISAKDVFISGAGDDKPNAGNQYGVNILRASAIALTNVSVFGGTSIGISVVMSEDVVLRNISVNGPSGVAARFARSSLDLNSIVLQDSGQELLVAQECSRLNGVDINLIRETTAKERWGRFIGAQSGTLQMHGAPKGAFGRLNSGLILVMQ